MSRDAAFHPRTADARRDPRGDDDRERRAPRHAGAVAVRVLGGVALAVAGYFGRWSFERITALEQRAAADDVRWESVRTTLARVERGLERLQEQPR